MKQTNLPIIALVLAALAFAAGALNAPAEFGTPQLAWPAAGWFFLTIWLIITNYKGPTKPA
jgi:hypothetical protein